MEELTITAPEWVLIFFAVLISIKGSLSIADTVLNFMKARNERRLNLLKLVHEKQMKEAENPLEKLEGDK